MEQVRWLRPIAHIVLRSDLWRFHRRSVPRGVALGLIVGIFLMIPGLQMIGAVLVSLPFRANIPLAVGMTFLSNPLTTPFILLASLGVGNKLFGLHADVSTFLALFHDRASMQDYVNWLYSDAAPALLGGLAVISLTAGVIGYFIAVYLWHWWIRHKWRSRVTHRQTVEIGH
ncbi:MAG: DUF2062 domain-containing protein [Sphingomonadaceae bacterium]